MLRLDPHFRTLTATLGLALMVLTLVPAVPAAAQPAEPTQLAAADEIERHIPLGLPGSGSPEVGHHSLAFRGGDKSHCSSFLLTEAAALVALKADPGMEKKQSVYGA